MLREIAKKARMAATVLKGKGEEYRTAALRWARLLIEFGPMFHHRLASKHLPIIQLYNIDIILFITSAPIVSLVLVYYFLKQFLRILSSKPKQKKL